MMSPSDTTLVEGEGADMDGADRDGAEREEGANESNCCDLNYALLRLMVVASMHIWQKSGRKRENE